jgi:hypothetical protein
MWLKGKWLKWPEHPCVLAALRSGLNLTAQGFALLSIWQCTYAEKGLCQVLYSIWALGPPAWFAFEYAWLFDWANEDLKKWERLQDLARTYWTGVLTVLSVVYLSRFGMKL